MAVGMLAERPVAANPPWPIDTEALLARWQGAWIMRDEQELGSIAAWDVHGDHVTIWDARNLREQQARLVFDAPCAYQLHFADGYTTGRFVFEGTTLHAGLGDAGVTLGNRLIACTEHGGVIVDGKTCTFDYQYEDTWLHDRKDCTFDDGVLDVRFRRGYDPELKLHGDLLADDQLWDNTPVRAAS
jgi:hypothetical protein